MIEQDKRQFAAILGGMAEVYGKEISKQALALDFKVLEAFSIEEVQAAAIAILATRKYSSLPPPADFIEHMGGGSIEDQAEVVAAQVLSAIGKHGGYNSVVFDDATTMAVIQQCYGGWPQMCAECGVSESEKWFRHNFAKSWAAFKRQGVQVFGVLAGIFEIQNSANGFLEHIPQPKLVGNPEKAQAVLEAGRQMVLESSLQNALPVGQGLLEGAGPRGSRNAPASISEILSAVGVTQ